MTGEPFPGEVYTELHVYPQEAWHSPAYLVGNKTGIKRLRDLCDKALADGEAECDFLPEDGEGYPVCVKIVDELTFGKLMHFYAAEEASDNRDGVICPWDLPSA